MQQKYLTNGFTLLEFLVVLALSGVTLWISIPALTGTISKLELRHTAARVSATVTRSVSRARREGNSLLIRVSERELEIAGAELLSERILFPERVTGIRKETPLRFSPRGVVTPGRIGLSSGDMFCEVIISLRGRVRERCH